jgi:heme/copper-type cytochrome/quinol oxidase subunit 2
LTRFYINLLLMMGWGMSNVDKVINKTLEIITQLQSVATDATHSAINYLPDAVNLGLTAVRVDGVNDILMGLFCALCVFVLAKLFKLASVRADAGTEQYNDSMIDCVYAPISLIVIPMIGIIFLFISASNLLSAWTYVKIFEPKVYLAHKVVEKVLEKKHG